MYTLTKAFNNQHLFENNIITGNTSAGLQPCLLLKFYKIFSFESISDKFVMEEEGLIIPNNKLSTKFTY